MGRLVYDHTRLREPNLLVPGKKPVGLVRVDQSNPMAKGLELFYSPGLNPINRDLLGKACTPVGSVKFGVDGGGIYLSDFGASSYLELSQDVSFPDKLGTVLIFLKTTTSNAGFGILGADAATSHYPYNGKTYIELLSNYRAVVNSPSNITERHCYAQTINTYYSGAKNLRVFHDGIKQLEADWNNTGGLSWPNPAKLGSGNGWTFNGVFYDFIVFNRCLSEAEIASLSLDPYQFLVPA